MLELTADDEPFEATTPQFWSFDIGSNRHVDGSHAAARALIFAPPAIVLEQNECAPTLALLWLRRVLVLSARSMRCTVPMTATLQQLAGHAFVLIALVAVVLVPVHK